MRATLRSALPPLGHALWPRQDQPGADRRLGHLIVAASVVALGLYLAGAMLPARSGHDVSDFLEWTSPRDQGAVAAMIDLWRQSNRLVVVYLYLALDSVLFVPLYTLLVLSVADGVSERRGTEERRSRLAFQALAVPALGLALVDLAENSFGLAHVGVAGVLLALASPALGILWLSRLDRKRQLLDRVGRWGLLVALVLALSVTVLGLRLGATCHADPDSVPIWRLGCATHRAKEWLAQGTGLLVTLGGASWLFGLGLRWVKAHERLEERGRFRAALWDVVGRSRYVLLALVLVYGLLVRMDQGRDVVYAVASAPFSTSGGAWRAWLGTAVACLAMALAVWLLMFTCWLWARSVCQLRSPGSGAAGAAESDGGGTGEVRPEDLLPRSWARALAAVPAVLLVLLCAGTIRDIVSAPNAGSNLGVHWLRPALVVAVLAVITVVGGLAFLGGRSLQPDVRYYDCLRLEDWAARAGLLRRSGLPAESKYRLGPLNARWLPVVLCGLMLALRALDAVTQGGAWAEHGFPTSVLAVVLLAVSLWLCLFGWLSMLEVHKSIPAVGLLLVVVGVLGVAGATDNHVVWSAAAAGPVPGAALAGLRMLAFTLLVSVVLALGYLRVLALVERRLTAATEERPRPAWRRWLGLAALALALGCVLWAGDRLATSRPATPRAVPVMGTTADPRPTLDGALADWLRRLHRPEGGGAIPQEGPQVVYLVSSEGGGIRAAAWTAFLLQRFARSDPSFLDRTFSISGVSGGAVGAAVFRACRATCAADTCLLRFARTNLLAPLLAAWTFEDGLARVLPTSQCSTPGCGFMSRAAWFEQALESGADAPAPSPEERSRCPASLGLRQGLSASRQAPSPEPHFVPYLLLNATWVESGERAIASDLRIDAAKFGDARDQLAIAGQDLPLATAAHNAARFPYINAIGALRGPRWLCRSRSSPPAPPPAMTEADREVEICGHLADGGYFDNTGAQSTLDVLRALSRCLEIEPGDPDAREFPACVALGGERRWLRAHLVPQVLMLRNGGELDAEPGAPCPAPRERVIPTRDDILPGARPACTYQTQRYASEQPTCVPAAGVFVDLLAPPLTALHSIGTGASGRLAEARLKAAVAALRARLGGEAARGTLPPVQVVDLVQDGIRYPLGWHLSDLAVSGIQEQANLCTLPGAPVMASGEAVP